MTAPAHVVVHTTRFAADLDALLAVGFRVQVILPADAPTSAVVEAHGLRLRLESSTDDAPVTVELVGCDAIELTLPGGSTITSAPDPSEQPIVLPDNQPSVVIMHGDADGELGRAGMRYRDLLPDRWGGRFISSHITIPDGGPVADYVHHHRIRFQMIFVKAGWVRVVYEDQGDPFVMHAGDCVLQPPGIRHRVLESSPGLEVIEIGSPAEHATLADWTLPLPTPALRPDRVFDGQRFVRHIAADATYAPWWLPGWEYRDTGIGAATDGLAGVRVARPTGEPNADPPVDPIAHDGEFTQLVVLAGSLRVRVGSRDEAVGPSSAITIPAMTPYALFEPSSDCELLDVTLPADVAIDTVPVRA